MTTERPAPYPADTRARGWRFELDYEQIEQSDTWDMAAEIPMAQHALLMMWLIAWRQEPCGSFPNDEALIRAKCRLPQKVWAQCRSVLMRGWWLADDGRLYHDTIANRVFAMLDKRANDAQRAATRRARKSDTPVNPGGVTPESRVTHTGVPPEFDTKHQAPSTSNSVPDGTGGAAADPATLTKDELWKAGKSLLSGAGIPEAQCGSFVGKLVKDYGDQIVVDAVRAAVVARPADPAEYLKATCMRAAGKRVNGNHRPTSHTGLADKDFSQGVTSDGRLI